jgi:hypothetical protein
MTEKCYKITRADGEELGTFDRRDEAERTAEYDAQSRGYGIRWAKFFDGAQGMPTTSGRNVFGYELKEVSCE